jgi:AcrR family transcriptional regulator
MERILGATETLLAEAPFESISVADIVRRARTSVGAFYARFPKKEDLLPALYSRRYGAAHRRRSLEYLDQLAVRSLPLEDLAAEVVRNMVAYYDFNALLLREVDRQTPRDSASRVAAERDHQTAFHDGWAAAFLASPEKIARPEPEKAVRFALFLVSAACREAILYPERSPDAIGDEDLETALSRSLVSCLR